MNCEYIQAAEQIKLEEWSGLVHYKRIKYTHILHVEQGEAVVSQALNEDTQPEHVNREYQAQN